MIRPGEPWGEATNAPADAEVSGSDAALAAAAAAAPGALLRFRPNASSDLARAVGLRSEGPTPDSGLALPVDALALQSGDDAGAAPLAGGALACNLCVVGVPPDRLRWSSGAHAIEVRLDGRPWFAGRATTVVVANGQFLRGNDVVPRGHPGDGKTEIQVYELRRGERRAMRRRLPTGAHVPHPRIRARTAGTVELRAPVPLAFEVDGVARSPVSGLLIRVVSPAFRLLL